MTNDLLFEGTTSDPDDWDAACDTLTYIMMEKELDQHELYVEVRNSGWMKRNGHKTMWADDGRALLAGILPHCDCTFRVYPHENGLAINNAHHDSPVWAEWYYITPVEENECDAR